VETDVESDSDCSNVEVAERANDADIDVDPDIDTERLGLLENVPCDFVRDIDDVLDSEREDVAERDGVADGDPDTDSVGVATSDRVCEADDDLLTVTLANTE